MSHRHLKSFFISLQLSESPACPPAEPLFLFTVLDCSPKALFSSLRDASLIWAAPRCLHLCFPSLLQLRFVWPEPHSCRLCLLLSFSPNRHVSLPRRLWLWSSCSTLRKVDTSRTSTSCPRRWVSAIWKKSALTAHCNCAASCRWLLSRSCSALPPGDGFLCDMHVFLQMSMWPVCTSPTSTLTWRSFLTSRPSTWAWTRTAPSSRITTGVCFFWIYQFYSPSVPRFYQNFCTFIIFFKKQIKIPITASSLQVLMRPSTWPFDSRPVWG